MYTAQLRNLRQGSRKVRLVANLIKGQPVNIAERRLQLLNVRPAQPLLTLLRSALANAASAGADTSALVISRITVGQGQSFKRIAPRAFGRAFPIKRHASHVHLTLSPSETKKSTRRSSAKNN